MKLAKLDLPEWAWLSGGDHEPKGDALKHRSVIYHVRSASVIEILERDLFIPAEDVLIYEFEYNNRFGFTEKLTAVLHYSVGIDFDDDETEREILEKAAKWYMAYCDWEDGNIENDDTALLN